MESTLSKNSNLNSKLNHKNNKLPSLKPTAGELLSDSVHNLIFCS